MPLGLPFPPSLAPSSFHPLPTPALVVLAGSPRAEFQRKSGQKPEPARTWEGEEEREEEGLGSGRDRVRGPGGSESAAGPGWGRRRRRSARGRDTSGGIHPQSRGAERLVPPRSPPSSAAASVNPPSGETCWVPSACRPALPSAWPPTRDLPCAHCPPDPRSFPFPPRFPGVRGSGPPSSDEGEGEDCPGRTETESGQAGVDAARGIVCVSVCVRVCACSIVSFGKHSGEVLSLGGGAQGTEAPAPGRGRVPRIPIAAKEAAGRGAWLEGGRREGRPGRPRSGDGPCSEVSASAAQPVSVQVRGSARERGSDAESQRSL